MDAEEDNMNAKLICIVSILLLAATQSGMATPGAGLWFFTGATRVQMGADRYALDGLDSRDLAVFVSPKGWMAGAYKVSGQDGWDGDTGFWSSDIRAPLLPGQVKTWMLYIWAPPGATPSSSWLGWGADIEDPNVIPRLEYVQRPQGVVGGPALGTVWTTPPGLFLPPYSTPDGTGGHGFRFSLSMIPEPSPLAAVSLGLAPLGIAAARRKRR